MRPAPAARNPAFTVAWLVALAFLAGFIGYLAVSAPVVATVYDERSDPARVSGPVSAEWNIERDV
ncbi:MAG: hypothetical protein WCY15_11460 [Phenylobacterium sp.]|jgi:hypothetical protein|uniref:hypothetical protein n=1 Tax=Phenylobacterium sp. TaxID=1871053 RepID=UPI002A261381|nr:hypothetical protein [Phenylobacterium sp.]MDD3837139.1 hypothetical protein [Phenylobacterium sp.]MDX9996626.1 hypothetical protein [Phenylobacterium sp.]